MAASPKTGCRDGPCRFLGRCLVGGGCGALKGGRFLKYAENTPMMNLGLSLLDKVGIEREKIGDSTGRLTGL